MKETPDLLSRFQEIINNEPARPTGAGEQEFVSLLYATNWVRILVVRQSENPQPFVIDVEVSQPCSSLSLTSSFPLASKQTSDDTRQLLELLIEHIKYILKLESSGFSIDFVGSDCLMLAFRSFTGVPSTEIFKLLLPPSTVN